MPEPEENERCIKLKIDCPPKKDGGLKATEDRNREKRDMLDRKRGTFRAGKVEKEHVVKDKIECVTYHIYSDSEGKIEKYTPKEITKGYEKSYQYIVYQSDNMVYSCVLEKNEYTLLPFPEKGYNWGRYGGRDRGGDNWIEEKTCAALLGFFYSLPKNNFKDTLYYNDISANDKRDIGHKTHRGGQDVDIRYPGSHDGSPVLWREAMKKYKDEKEFVSVLENILYVATLWGFNTNYAYKPDIKYTKGTAISVHQDHFHIGLR